MDWSAAYVFHSTTVTTVHVECRCMPSNRQSAMWNITPALQQLHWLPVRQQIQYMLASLAFSVLLGLALDYLAGHWQLVAVSGRRPLRSAEWRICHVPRQNSTFGDRSFAAAGPRTWNELPFSLRDTGLSLTTFNEHLKTYLFYVHLWHLWFLCAVYKFTYLLTLQYFLAFWSIFLIWGELQPSSDGNAVHMFDWCGYTADRSQMLQ